ncbi:MAG: redoxin family protein [Anaerovoracaceae bacterium]
MKKRKLIIVFLAVTLTLVLASCTQSEKTESKGGTAPDFTLTDLNGNTVKLSDFAKDGKKVYLDFWASWCSICLDGLEEVNSLSASDKDFKVLTIVAPGYNGEMKIEEFKKWFSDLENTENMVVLIDEDGKYSQQLGVNAYPTAAYIGSNGSLAQVLPGYNDIDTIKANFEAIK